MRSSKMIINLLKDRMEFIAFIVTNASIGKDLV